MKCVYCKGSMQRKKAPFHIDKKGYHQTLDDIPAWVCSECGEVYFEDSEVDTIQELLESLDERAKKLQEAA